MTGKEMWDEDRVYKAARIRASMIPPPNKFQDNLQRYQFRTKATAPFICTSQSFPNNSLSFSFPTNIRIQVPKRAAEESRPPNTFARVLSICTKSLFPIEPV